MNQINAIDIYAINYIEFEWNIAPWWKLYLSHVDDKLPKCKCLLILEVPGVENKIKRR